MTFAAVYRGDAQALLQPQSFPLFGTKRATGGVSTEDSSLGFGEQRVLYAMPERHKPGALFFDAHLKLDAGQYVLGISVSSLGAAAIDPSAPVLEVRAGEDCSRVIVGSDLSQSFQLIPFACDIAQVGILEVSGYWTGTTALAVDLLRVVRADGLLAEK